jgi:TonB family protein
VWPTLPANVRALLSAPLKLDVKLTVDEKGAVSRAEPVVSTGALSAFLGKLAADTARRWSFQPAREGNRAVPGEVVLHFKFAP